MLGEMLLGPDSVQVYVVEFQVPVPAIYRPRPSEHTVAPFEVLSSVVEEA